MLSLFGTALSEFRARLSWSLSSARTITRVHCRTRPLLDLARDPPWTLPYRQADSWKACWGQPLTSSNLVSSASASPGTKSKGPAACSGALRRCPYRARIRAAPPGFQPVTAGRRRVGKSSLVEGFIPADRDAAPLLHRGGRHGGGRPDGAARRRRQVHPVDARRSHAEPDQGAVDEPAGPRDRAPGPGTPRPPTERGMGAPDLSLTGLTAAARCCSTALLHRGGISCAIRCSHPVERPGGHFPGMGGLVCSVPTKEGRWPNALFIDAVIERASAVRCAPSSSGRSS
ncbi:hypothetical protein STENM36S_04346 [Streptomyces tendae]